MPAVVTQVSPDITAGMLATVSPAGFPHVAGVLYELVDEALYINTMMSSRKARNIAQSGHVAISIPVRRTPVGGPPSAVQFQAGASLLSVTDTTIADLVAGNRLRSITAHGELDLPDSCFVRIGLPDRMHTYGLGMSLVSLIRDPLGAAGEVDLLSSPRAGHVGTC